MSTVKQLPLHVQIGVIEKRAEQLLRDSEELLKQALNTGKKQNGTNLKEPERLCMDRS